MARSKDLAGLSQLTRLCDARNRLAIQAQAESARQVETATLHRQACEGAVADAQHAWQGAVGSAILGPDLASAAGDVLVERAAALTLSAARESEAQGRLNAHERARREAGARLQQVEQVTAACRRQLHRKRDERLLARIEDRTTYRWRQI